MRNVIQFAPAQRMERISDASIDLVVTAVPDDCHVGQHLRKAES